MKILVINGDCILRNTSANLCHLAYIKGLVELGHEVTLLSADGRDYVIDQSMAIPDGVKNYTYYGVSLYERLSLHKKKNVPGTENSKVASDKEDKNSKRGIIGMLKQCALSYYGIHGIYAKFVKKAQKFRSKEEFDYILSISTPVTSHLLAHNLLKAGHISGKHWIQIWEDPWYNDVYGFNSNIKVYREEKRLLSYAEKVYYVSPLTLCNQQKLYPQSAEKMYWNPLPYYYKDDDKMLRVFEKNIYGYFGDYVPVARNLEPFYQAARQTGIEVNICGNPDRLFSSTEHIHIYPRLPLEQLKSVEDNTNILIFLCNRKGGQIPGKIYQYSATNKVILFIMDGTPEEKEVLKNYFAPFNRYIFCKNTVEDIARAICRIENGDFGTVKNEPVETFSPLEITRKILAGE